MQLILVLFAVAMGYLAFPTGQAGAHGLLVAFPAILAAGLFAGAYAGYVYRERAAGWRALYRFTRERSHEQLIFVVAGVLVGGPLALVAVKTSELWQPRQHALWLAWLEQSGLLLFPLLVWLVLLVDARYGGGWWGFWGGGGGDEPDGPDEPPWWPDFESEFRHYAGNGRTSPQPRQPVGV